MPIISISRDWGSNPSMVRITTTDNLATVATSNYILNQEPVIEALNKGAWQWVVGDLVAVSASDGDNIFNFNGNDFSTLLPVSSGGNANVIFPVNDNNFVVFDGTSGDLHDVGYFPSNSFALIVIMGLSGVTPGNIPKYNDSLGTLEDSGVSASALSTAITPIGKIVYVDYDILASDIASGGNAFVVPAVFNQSFKIRSFMVNQSPGMTGGDKLIILQDGNGILVELSATIVGTPVNTLWNNTGDVLFAPGQPQNVTTGVGNGLFFTAFSGTTDYTDGSVNITLAYERIT